MESFIRASTALSGGVPSTLSLTNSTVSGNRAEDGGGIVSQGFINNNTITLANSIVAGNAAQDLDNFDTDLVFNGGNIIGDTFTVDGGSPQAGIALTDIFATVGNDPNTEVLSGLLADNGGPVQTIALNPNATNPAIDSGDPDLLDETLTGTDLNGDGDTDDVITTDARGLPRIALETADLGAFEVQAITEFTVTTLDDELDAADTDLATADLNDISLREALALANADPDANTINFDAALAGGTLTLTNGELTITSDGITIDGDIDGDGDADIAISGNNASRVLSISNATTIGTALNGLVIQDGSTAGSGGGISNDGSKIALTNSTLSGNGAGFAGGGIYNLNGTVTLTNTTLSGNDADNFGGGLANVGGTATLTNTTLSRPSPLNAAALRRMPATMLSCPTTPRISTATGSPTSRCQSTPAACRASPPLSSISARSSSRTPRRCSTRPQRRCSARSSRTPARLRARSARSSRPWSTSARRRAASTM